MHALRVEVLATRQLEQGAQHVAAGVGRTGLARDAKSIAAPRDFHVESALDLSEVFVELTAQVGEAVVVGGLENYVPADLDSVQNRSSDVPAGVDFNNTGLDYRLGMAVKSRRVTA